MGSPLFPFIKDGKPGRYSNRNGGAYFHTKWRCPAALSPRSVGLGDAETPLTLQVAPGVRPTSGGYSKKCMGFRAPKSAYSPSPPLSITCAQNQRQ